MSSRKELKYLFLVFITFIAACVETDIYLPAFPDMMKAFSASEGAIQGLLTWNFVGICLAGPFYGPLSDAWGRKRPLMIALGMFLLGSLLTFIAQDMQQMLWGRILQGIGSGGCFTLGTAIIFDSFQKERAIIAVNRLNMIIPLVMAGAPMLGGYLNNAFGFRSNFLAIGFFVLVSFVVSLTLFEESLPKEKRVAFEWRSMLRDFKLAFTHSGFWQLTLTMSLTFSAYIAFLSGASVLFPVEFQVDKKIFPFFQVAILGGWVLGSLFLKRALNYLGAQKIKKLGPCLCGVGGVLLLFCLLFAPRNPHLLTIAMMIYAFGANWICGLYFPESMELLPNIKGIAASLMTSARLLIASLVVGFSSSIYNKTAYPLILIVLGTLFIIFPLLFYYEKRKNSYKEVPE